MITLSSKQLEALQFYFDDFQIWPEKKKISDERIERQKKLQSLLSSEEKIDELSKPQVDEIENSLWATQTRFQKPISSLNDLDKIKHTWKYLLYGKDDPFERAHKVNNEEKYKLQNFGESKISELLSKVRLDQEIALLNARIKNLAERLGFKLTYGESYGEKLKAYDAFVKLIQKSFNLKNLDETDFFIFFVDYYPNYYKDKKEPLPRFKQGEFSFVEEDFKSTTGKKEDAQYIHKRFKLLHNVLKESLGEEYEDYKSYVSRPNKRPIKGKGVQYYEVAWLGFAPPKAVEKRIQESIQLQVTLHKEYVSADIWVSFVAKEKIKELQNRIKSNKQQFIQFLKDLPPDYFIGASIRGNEEQVEYYLSEITEEKIDDLFEILSKANSEFNIGTHWEKKEALQKGSEIVTDLVDSFEKLLPAYNFINGFEVKPTIIKMPVATNSDKFSRYEKLLEQKKQIVFYGPPGTGKTYFARKLACNFHLTNYLATKDITESFEALQKSRFVDIIQFHPSYSYEDFVEGIRPVTNENSSQLEYKVQDGIFKKFCLEAESINDDEDHYFALINDYQEISIPLRAEKLSLPSSFGGGMNSMTKSEFKKIIKYMQSKKDDISEIFEDLDNFSSFFRLNTKIDTELNIDGARYYFSKYAHSYKKFLDAIEAGNVAIVYHDRERDGFFGIAVIYQNNYVKNPKFILIIDEINRGNLSKIFGELIYGLEYRDTGIMTQYSEFEGESSLLKIPKNLLLIGTMNTADRSISLFDTALRRRFAFVELLPDYELLVQHLGIADEFSYPELYKKFETEGGSEPKLLSVLALYRINQIIMNDIQLGREKQIGHSYLLDLAKDIAQFYNIWRYEIIPLLEEFYFAESENLERILSKEIFDKNEGIKDFSDAELIDCLHNLAKSGNE